MTWRCLDEEVTVGGVGEGDLGDFAPGETAVGEGYCPPQTWGVSPSVVSCVVQAVVEVVVEVADGGRWRGRSVGPTRSRTDGGHRPSAGGQRFPVPALTADSEGEQTDISI